MLLLFWNSKVRLTTPIVHTCSTIKACWIVIASKMNQFFYLTIPFDYNLSLHCLNLNHKRNSFFRERNATPIWCEKECFITKTRKCCHQVHHQNEIIIMEILIKEVRPLFRMKNNNILMLWCCWWFPSLLNNRIGVALQ